MDEPLLTYYGSPNAPCECCRCRMYITPSRTLIRTDAHGRVIRQYSGVWRGLPGVPTPVYDQNIRRVR